MRSPRARGKKRVATPSQQAQQAKHHRAQDIRITSEHPSKSEEEEAHSDLKPSVDLQDEGRRKMVEDFNL